MRFDYINLRAFGHFTDYELSYDPDKNFHLIYGPNEAGKSTTLRSITNFLYGFPQKTNDSFLHSNTKLRIEGQLKNANGEALQFIRRKGRKDTVLDLDGKPINEKVINEFLHGLSEDQFTNMFALDHIRLREGGESLLQSNGSVGESVFSAASGINVLRKILDNLDKETSLLYKKTGSNPALNKLLSKEKELNKQLTQNQLKIQEWKELERNYHEGKQEINELIHTVRKLRNEKEKLQRVKLLLPKLAKQKNLISKLAELSDVPELPDGVKDLRTTAENQLYHARKDIEKVELELTVINNKLEEVSIPTRVLEQASLIDGLYREVQSYQEQLTKLPELEGTKKQLEAQVISVMKDINTVHAEIEKIDLYRLSAEKKETIRELCKQKPLLYQTFENIERESTKWQRELEQKLIDLTEIPEILNLEEIENTLDKVKRSGQMDDNLKAFKHEMNEKEREINEAIRLLPLWDGTEQELLQLPIPVLQETIKKFEKERNYLTQQLEKIQDQIQLQHEAIEDYEESIRQIDSLAEIPSEDKLNQVRSSRDAGWSIIRTKLQTDQWNKQLEEYTKGETIESVYEENVRNADYIADTMRLEAEKVGQKNKLLADIESCQKKLIDLENEEQCIKKELNVWENAWGELWKPAQITPLTPEEMREWLLKYDHIKTLVQDQGKRLANIKEYETHYEQSKKTLLTILRPIMNVSEEQTLDELLLLADKQFKQMRELNNKRASLEESIRETQEKIKAYHHDKKEIEKKIDDWKKEWIQAVQNTDISAETSPNVAEKLVLQYENCASVYDKFKEIEKEQEFIHTQVLLFNQRVRDVHDSVEISMDDQNIDIAVNQLYALLQKSQQDQIINDNFLKQQEVLQSNHKEAIERQKEAQDILEDLFKKAKCQNIDELQEIEKRFLTKQEFESSLRDVEEEILALGNGQTLQELISESEQYNPDSIDGELDEINRELENIESDRSNLEQAYGVVKKEYEEKIQGNNTATVLAQQEKESIHAQIVNVTDQYIQLKLASILLQKGIEYYRNQNQNPILKRASEIFSRLTLKSFKELTVDYNEKDQPILMGIRVNDEKVSIEGMSDGTTDQLYLSLRIASIEKYVHENEPIPFIVDDILVHFDDIRSKETLSVLMELSNHTQIIFFTHHARLIEIMNDITEEEEYQLIDINQDEMLLTN